MGEKNTFRLITEVKITRVVTTVWVFLMVASQHCSLTQSLIFNIQSCHIENSGGAIKEILKATNFFFILPSLFVQTHIHVLCSSLEFLFYLAFVLSFLMFRFFVIF